MIYLLSEEGRQALRAIASKPVLYAFDFDGTLAPISPDRNAVTLPPSVSEWIRELAKRAPCAVVSGRALADLAPRLNGAVPYLIGNHGLESSLTPLPTLLWAEGICAGWKRTLDSHMAQGLKDLGVDVEDKRYSLTLHHRGLGTHTDIHQVVLSLLLLLTPAPSLIFGKASVNIVPPGKGGKGSAALQWMVHLRRTGLFFVGDDETDEDVFALTEGLAMGVRVGQHTGSRARYFIHHQGEIEEVLRFLVHRIDRTPESLSHGDRHANSKSPAAHER
ncbi:trehalose-phosphatase [Nitrospira sp. NS4]|uniref:trehalose-phosphatase n=1 Tax=Nitrospira sp. NS4 TaxID=3414498 RepID=UPI003C2CECB2